jgi:uncharacterized membrane protein YgcG
VAAGELLSSRQREEVVRTVRLAQQESGLRFSVYVGETDDDTRGYARRLHGALGREAARSVLVAVDPQRRRLEIVTGEHAARQLDDRACALAAMSMTSSFSAGDLAGGIAGGVVMLGDHARQPRTLHTDQA